MGISPCETKVKSIDVVQELEVTMKRDLYVVLGIQIRVFKWCVCVFVEHTSSKLFIVILHFVSYP